MRSATIPSLFLAICLAGCASSKVGNEIDYRTAKGAPSMIYIENFDLGQTVVQSDPGTISGRKRLIDFREQDPAKKLQELSDLLAKSLVEDLNKKNIPAT